MKKNIFVILYSILLWALCGATIGIGRMLVNMDALLIIHAIAAPLFAMIISSIYYKQFALAKPVSTSVIFLVVVMLLDAGLVAPVFEKSYVMFTSFLGTWLPFILIFLSVYITGVVIRNFLKSKSR